ncbi:hypothetical protein GGF43_004543, partial [Coemansia sp. RSA 2618]
SSSELVSWPKLPAQTPAVVAPSPRLATASTAHKRRSTVPQSGRGRSSRAFFRSVHQERELSTSPNGPQVTVRMHPQVDRGFFVSDADWTCYRRNYFQVSCTFTLAGAGAGMPVFVTDGGGTRAVQQFLIGISARIAGSDCSTGVELVQHTPKRDKGPQMTPQPQPVRRSDTGLVDVSGTTASFERLQFKTATANNGKRRAAQQYYILELVLLADCDDGARVSVATTESPPIVVRGRSPGHYADPGRRISHKASLSESTVMAPDSSTEVPNPAELFGPGPMAAMGASLSHDPARPHAPPPPSSASRSQSSDVLAQGFSGAMYPDSVPQYTDNSSAAAVAAALAVATGDPAGFGMSADDMVQALAAMVPPTVPPPQEILARAHMSDALGLAGIGLAKPKHDDAISSDMTLSMAASIAGSVPDALSTLDMCPLPMQPTSTLDSDGRLDSQTSSNHMGGSA